MGSNIESEAGSKVTPKIVTLAKFECVGLSDVFKPPQTPGADNMQVIPALWEKFNSRRDEIADKQARYVGLIAVPDSESVPPGKLRYTAAVEVGTVGDVPSGMTVCTVPGGEYAQIVHKGPVDRISETMGLLYGTWLPRSGYRRGTGPDIELYPADYDGGSEGSEMNLLVPLAR